MTGLDLGRPTGLFAGSDAVGLGSELTPPCAAAFAALTAAACASAVSRSASCRARCSAATTAAFSASARALARFSASSAFIFSRSAPASSLRRRLASRWRSFSSVSSPFFTCAMDALYAFSSRS